MTLPARRVIGSVMASLLGMIAAANANHQVRDTSTVQSRNGTAAIVGVVTTPDGAVAAPVRRATVQLTGSGQARPQLAITDDAGRFVFAGLSAGSFSLSATKPAYVPAFYGARRPGLGPAVPIAIADGAHINVAITMLHGGVITGTIVDPNGRPASDVSVEAISYQRQSSTGALTPSARPSPVQTITDDRGAYRIFGLAPGTYAVVAAARWPAGELTPTTAEELTWADQQTAAARSGRSLASPATLPAPKRPQGYAAVYYPGTTSAASASLIELAAGETRDGVRIPLQYVPTATVEGTVVGPGGLPAVGATVRVLSTASNDSKSVTLSMAGRGTPTTRTADGHFKFEGLAPGEYILWGEAGPTCPIGPPTPGSDTIGAIATPELWGRVTVGVTGDDRRDMTLQLQPGGRVTGRLAFTGSTLTPPTDFSRVQVILDSVDTVSPVTQAGRGTAVHPDGTFLITGVPPGQYRLRASILPGRGAGDAGWALQSAMSGDRDVIDQPFDLAPGISVDGLVVSFVDRPTAITGTLFDAAGHPTPAFAIVAFPTDPASWLPGSRRTKAARPGADGRFTIAGLPAGQYLLAVVTDFEPADLSDPRFLEQLRATSIPVTLTDGQQARQDIKIGG